MKKSKKSKSAKRLLTMVVAAALAVIASFPAFAGQWKKTEGGEYWQWWYEEDDGSYPVNDWREIDSKWYHFDPDGYMDVGWHYIDGQWYFFEKDGVMAAGTEYEGGHLGTDGAWISDLLPPDNYYVCSKEDMAYWEAKQMDYWLSPKMFVDNGDGTYTLTGSFDPETCVMPDFYNTILAMASLRYNGFTATFEYGDGTYSFIVQDVKYPE